MSDPAAAGLKVDQLDAELERDVWSMLEQIQSQLADLDTRVTALAATAANTHADVRQVLTAAEGLASLGQQLAPVANQLSSGGGVGGLLGAAAALMRGKVTAPPAAG